MSGSESPLPAHSCALAGWSRRGEMPASLALRLWVPQAILSQPSLPKPQDLLCSLLSFLPARQGREEGWSEPPHQAVTIKPIQSPVICMQLLPGREHSTCHYLLALLVTVTRGRGDGGFLSLDTASQGEVTDEGPGTFPPALAGL